MDAVWTALDGHKACRVKKYEKSEEKSGIIKKILDWKLMQGLDYAIWQKIKKQVIMN